jgi:hypothetical protein
MSRFYDQKARSPDNTDNHITAPNTRDAVSLHADDEAAIGKVACDKTTEIKGIKPNGERPMSRGRFDGDAVSKEVINPHLNKILKWLNGHAAAWKALNHDDIEAFADTTADSVAVFDASFFAKEEHSRLTLGDFIDAESTLCGMGQVATTQ